MTYLESVRFLYSLGNEVQTAKLGLERMGALLGALGNPERAYRVAHVAGTNGKGSTCALIEAGLRAAGVRTGLFTSPHLEKPTERIRVEGLDVAEAAFARAFGVVHQTAEKLALDCHPTYFETVTAMAFWWFREMGVETAVVEVGLGGRLDATNVVEPAVTAITAIDFDHQGHLGETIEAIAAEKAGILKRGVPAVLAGQPHPQAAAVVEARAAQMGAPVIRMGDFQIHDLLVDARGSSFRLEGQSACATFRANLECPLAGEHQIENAATAALTLHQLGVSPEGMVQARWPGRLEQVAPNPDTILDGAHNPGSALALARYLRRFYSHRHIWMIFGVMNDKAAAEIAAVLFPLAQELILTAPSSPRAVRPEDLAELAGGGHAEPNVAAALDFVRGRASAEDAIVITGSLYLVGEARAILRRHSNQWE